MARPPTTIQIRLLFCTGLLIFSLSNGSNMKSAKIKVAVIVPRIPATLPNLTAASNMTKRKSNGTKAFDELLLKINAAANALAAHMALPTIDESHWGRRNVFRNITGD
jgi:hypothetical protein